MRRVLSISAMIAMFIAANRAEASLVFGVVEDNTGHSVESVDLEFRDPADGSILIFFNDATDASGSFLVDVPNRSYDIYFVPPAPPDTSLRPSVLRNVVISGLTDLGTVVLVPGLVVTGILRTNGGVGVGGVDIDIEESTFSDPEILSNDNSEADGSFIVVVPQGTWDFLFDVRPSTHPTLASKAVASVDVNGTLDLGVITLPPGFLLSATVVDPGANPVGSVDINVRHPTTGVKLYTPGDNSDGTGFVGIRVEAGTWDIEFRPPVATRLRGKRVTSVTVSGDTSLGTVALSSGVKISGLVRDPQLQPHRGTSVRMFNPSTNDEIFIAWGSTKIDGTYEVIVPTGVWDVGWVPPLPLPYAAQWLDDLSIGGDLIRNIDLQDCPTPSEYGQGTPGSGGFTPKLGTTGLARVGSTDFALRITEALGSAQGFLLLSFAPADLPGNGFRLNVDPSFGFTILAIPILGPPIAGQGFLTLPGSIPDDRGIGGVTLYLQVLVIDAGASNGISASRGLSLPICD